MSERGKHGGMRGALPGGGNVSRQSGPPPETKADMETRDKVDVGPAEDRLSLWIGLDFWIRSPCFFFRVGQGAPSLSASEAAAAHNDAGDVVMSGLL